MKIYNKIIWDKDFNIIEEDSYEYEGPVAYTKGKPRPLPVPPPPPPGFVPLPGPRPKSKRAYIVGKSGQKSSEIGSESRDDSLLNVRRRSGRKSLVSKRGEALGASGVSESKSLLGSDKLGVQ